MSAREVKVGFVPERTMIANRSHNDFPSQGPDRKDIPQKERHFQSEFAESNHNR